MRKSYLLRTFCACLLMTCAGATSASPAKFNIPGDFPGNFRIDFLGTDFKLNGDSAGALSTASTIQFSVGSETSPGSGIYNITVSPSGFDFLGFVALGLPFDVFGAGTGSGTFNSITGDWAIDMPTLFVNVSGSGPGQVSYGTRLDFHLTTSNIFISTDNFGGGYWTTTATPMVIDESSSTPWGDLNLVAGGRVPNSADLLLSYDYDLINSIGSTYKNFQLDTDVWEGVPYEFDIYGNDPQISNVPLPAAVWLLGSGLLGLTGIAGRKKVT